MKIGVFDSGVGGLTVLRELLRQVPGAEYLYFGDTARLPYGSKSAQTVAKYAVGAAQFLAQQGAEFLVVACNTASALALDAMQREVSIPMLGVIVPGADEALLTSRTRSVIVIATEATVGSHAYKQALEVRGLRAEEKACPLFVPLVEEGWVDHPVTERVAEIYLSGVFGDETSTDPDTRLKTQIVNETQTETRPDTLVLGCTHYPLIKELLRRVVPGNVRIIDSAEATAASVRRILDAGLTGDSSLRFFATDSTEKFRRAGEKFLGRRIDAVELVSMPE